MLLQGAEVAETFGTLRAAVRPVSRVDSHVSVKSSGPFECLVAHVTPERPLVRVHDHVKVYTCTPTKHLATYVTLAWFLSAVKSAVFSKLA